MNSGGKGLKKEGHSEESEHSVPQGPRHKVGMDVTGQAHTLALCRKERSLHQREERATRKTSANMQTVLHI